MFKFNRFKSPYLLFNFIIKPLDYIPSEVWVNVSDYLDNWAFSALRKTLEMYWKNEGLTERQNVSKNHIETMHYAAAVNRRNVIAAKNLQGDSH